MEFDPRVITYEQLIVEFFKLHDPSSQSSDRKFHGGQYRSSIFFHNPEQEKIARAVKGRLEKEKRYKFFTEIVPATVFTEAEDMHQDYYKNRGM